MRCVALAEEFARLNFSIVFIMDRPSKTIFKVLSKRSFKLECLTHRGEKAIRLCTPSISESWGAPVQDADANATNNVLKRSSKDDLLFLDHYSCDAVWTQTINFKGRVVVIDDLANRQQVCDFLIDQNPSRLPSEYDHLVNKDAIVLTGSRYTIIREQILKRQSQSWSHTQKSTAKEKLLISFGGADPQNWTQRTLDILVEVTTALNLDITVILGPVNPLTESDLKISKDHRSRVSVLKNPPNYADLLTEHLLVVGACGSACWEYLYLGIPSILLPTASNQMANLATLVNSQAAFVIKPQEDFEERLNGILNHALAHRKSLVELSKSAKRIVDGQGARRIVKKIMASKHV